MRVQAGRRLHRRWRARTPLVHRTPSVPPLSPLRGSPSRWDPGLRARGRRCPERRSERYPSAVRPRPPRPRVGSAAMRTSGADRRVDFPRGRSPRQPGRRPAYASYANLVVPSRMRSDGNSEARVPTLAPADHAPYSRNQLQAARTRPPRPAASAGDAATVGRFPQRLRARKRFAHATYPGGTWTPWVWVG
jgi:hypothetical protein